MNNSMGLVNLER